MTGTRETLSPQCAETRDCLSSMMDGEAGVCEAALAEQHVMGCAECAEFRSALHHLDAQLRLQLDEPCDTDKLWSDVKRKIAAIQDVPALLDAPAVSQDNQVVRVDRSKRFVFAAAASVVLCAMVGGVGYFSMRSRELSFVDETIRDFEAFRDKGRKFDVAASDPAHLRRWFSGKIDFQLPSDLSPPDGFTAEGARLCSFLKRRLVFIHYRKGEDQLSVYVTKAEGLGLPEQDQSHVAKVDRDFTTVTWRREELAVLVVSNVTTAELTNFTDRFNERLSPA